jgi:hypothetical protein
VAAQVGRVIAMRVLEATVAGIIVAVMLTFLVHRLHGHVDLVTLWGVTFLVTFITVVVLPRASGGRR